MLISSPLRNKVQSLSLSLFKCRVRFSVFFFFFCFFFFLHLQSSKRYAYGNFSQTSVGLAKQCTQDREAVGLNPGSSISFLLPCFLGVRVWTERLVLRIKKTPPPPPTSFPSPPSPLPPPTPPPLHRPPRPPHHPKKHKNNNPKHRVSVC